MNAYRNAVSRSASYRPDDPPCPAPMLVRISSRLSSARVARSRATHLAGSQYATRGSFSPVVTSIVAIAVVWRFLLEPDSGIVNTLLGYVGVDGPSWLNDQTWAMPSLIVMSAWRNMGYLVIIFLAGLQGVPTEMHEAAAIDGAGSWSRFRHMTLPLMRPTLLFGGVVTMIGYLQFFEEPFVMTQGGPLDSTLSTAYYTYNQFGFGNYSYAAAMAYVLFVVIALVTAVQFRLLGDRDGGSR